jgi:hypothetical protein
VVEAIQNHTDYMCEFRYARKGETEWRWMMGRGRAFYDNTVGPLGWLDLDGTSRNVSRQKKPFANSASCCESRFLA